MITKNTINCSGRLVDLTTPKVMGIINTTPDSFFAASRKSHIDDILATAEKMLHEGATFLDIGGYSSRPGANIVSEEEELNRVLGPIKEISMTFPEAMVSVDTFRATVARKAVEAGAVIINDISAGNLDSQMLKTVADLKVPYIAMHMRGTPQTMKSLTNYEDMMKEMVFYFSKLIRHCNDLTIKDVIIDVGLGFAKDIGQSFSLLKYLDYFKYLGKPMLVGVSRKSMIYKTLGISAEEALNGTSVLNALAIKKGANILRVHDTKEAVQAVKLLEQLT